MLNFWKFWQKTKEKKGEMEKMSEVLKYEEEALKIFKRITNLREGLYEPVEEETDERPERVQKKSKEKDGFINVGGRKIKILGGHK